MDKFIPTDEQWLKMKRFFKTDKYKKEDFFVFETLAVGDKIVPNRYIKLTPELLSVMKDDAQKGVSLMLNHNWSQLGVQAIPVGKVFDARIDGPSQSGETTTLYTTQYILRDDSKVDGYSKNDIINLIESGTISDTSVGWGTTSESYKCSICGNSIHDWRNCKHIPGQKYIVNEETNEVKQCIVEAKPPLELHEGNNVLMENSLVFDGAYSNAQIQSVVGSENENGFTKIEGKTELEGQDLILGYSTTGGFNLMYKKALKKGGLEQMVTKSEETTTELETVVENVETTEVEETVETTEEVTNVETTETTETTETVEEVEANTSSEDADDTVETVEEPTGETLYTEADILNKFENICGSIEELIAMAKEGVANREVVIQSALESGVHAMGNAFNKEVFTKTFSNLATKDIKEMAEAWEKQAKELFSSEKVAKVDAKPAENFGIKIPLSQFKTTNY